jgi:hypothetical protein
MKFRIKFSRHFFENFFILQTFLFRKNLVKLLGVKGELKLLQRLHELSGADVDICPKCESHLTDPCYFDVYDR